MRQQPYQHLSSQQPQNVQPSAQQKPRSANPLASIAPLTQILQNPATHPAVGKLLNNFMAPNNQTQPKEPVNINSTSQTNNYAQNNASNTASNNSVTSLSKNSLEAQTNIPQTQATSPQSNAPTSNNTESIFPSINPQFSLDTLLNPRAKTSQNEKVFNKNHQTVLKQMQLHSEYLNKLKH